jgi:hypothetical protein
MTTSVNLVHNAPVELPPARAGPPLLAPATRAGPPPVSWVITITENKTHQKKKNKGKLPGQTDRQTDTIVALIYKIEINSH